MTDRRNNIFMFRAIGFVIIIFSLSQIMSGTFQAFESAATEVFGTLEAAAIVSQEQLNK